MDTGATIGARTKAAAVPATKGVDGEADDDGEPLAGDNAEAGMTFSTGVAASGPATKASFETSATAGAAAGTVSAAGASSGLDT